MCILKKTVTLEEIYSKAINSTPFCFDKLERLMPKNGNEAYLFAMLAISKNEAVDKHVLACEIISKLHPLIEDADNTAISWHKRRMKMIGGDKFDAAFLPYNVEKVCHHKYDMKELYNSFVSSGCTFTLEELVRYLNSDNGDLVYSFILYAIMKSETIHRHLVAAESIMYLGCSADSSDWSLIFWHVKNAIGINRTDKELSRWIVDIFGDSPDSIWSEAEMNEFRKINTHI